jgi:hypothetical protein
VNTSLPVDSVQGLVLVEALVAGVVTSVDQEMRGQPAWMVREIIVETLARRLPGIAVDGELVDLAAARISVGLAPLPV